MQTAKLGGSVRPAVMSGIRLSLLVLVAVNAPVEVLDVTETFIMRGDIDDIKDGLIKEVASVMADMDEIQIRQFIAMMKAAKEVV